MQRLRLKTCSWLPLVSLLLLATCYKSVYCVCRCCGFQDIQPYIVYVFTISLAQANSLQYTMLTRVLAKRCPAPSCSKPSLFMPPSKNPRRRQYAVHCPSVNTYFAWRDISSVSGQIWIKLDTCTHDVLIVWMGIAEKRFSRSEVKDDSRWPDKLASNGSGMRFDGVAWRLTCFLLCTQCTIYI